MRGNGEAVGCLDNPYTSRAYSPRERAPNRLVKRRKGQQNLEEITLITIIINAFGCFGNLEEKLNMKIKGKALYRNTIISLLSNYLCAGTLRYVGQHTDQKNRVLGGWFRPRKVRE